MASEKIDNYLGMPSFPGSEDEEERERWLDEYERRVAWMDERQERLSPVIDELLQRREGEAEDWFRYPETGRPSPSSPSASSFPNR